MKQALLDLVTTLIPVIGTFLTAAATWALTEAAKYFKSKHKIALTDDQLFRTQEVVRQAIAYAEEFAHKKAKEGIVVPPSDKMDAALHFVELTAPSLAGVIKPVHIEAKLAAKRPAASTVSDLSVWE